MKYLLDLIAEILNKQITKSISIKSQKENKSGLLMTKTLIFRIFNDTKFIKSFSNTIFSNSNKLYKNFIIQKKNVIESFFYIEAVV